MATKSRTRPWERFVRAYMAGYHAGETSREIGYRLELSPVTVVIYASRLRKRGVKLPKLRERLDTVYLNGVILRSGRKGDE